MKNPFPAAGGGKQRAGQKQAAAYFSSELEPILDSVLFRD